MQIIELGVKENRIKALEKRNITAVEDVQEFFPRKYYDFSELRQLSPKYDNQYIAVTGIIDKVLTKKTNETLMVQAKVITEDHLKLNVQWIGAYYIYKFIKDWKNEKVIVCGKMTYFEEYHSFHMNNPIVFDRSIEKNLRVYPIYTKMSGISEEWMGSLISESLKKKRSENLSDDILTKYKLYGINQAICVMHNPKSMTELKNAQKRIVYDKLLRFAYKIEQLERDVSKGTIYNAKSMKNVYNLIDSLPYQLSEGQRTAVEEIKENMINGKRVNALIQGDVGSGKTIVAFLVMLLMADSGYQSVLMTPTQILAKQHFAELSKYADRYGYRVAFLGGDMAVKQKKEVLKDIKEGKCQFIVGTHAIVSSNIEYHNLALTITDEEHKFGVAQRNMLTDKARFGVHNIVMSATPIPRTMANVLYGTSISVYDFKPPAERQPIQTAIFNNENKIYEFMYKEIATGRQCYAVCPLIEAGENKEKLKGVLSVEETVKKYNQYFQQYPNVNIGVVTGKMNKSEMEDTIQKFSKNEIQILVSTTVIEVGVNVPNASVIVINNAERFGLAQLHQLRGRVGRGKDKAYCILKSSEKENERLIAMTKISDGYKIAEEDLRLRGTGDILGYSQSGENEYIELMLKYPNMYKAAQKDAKNLADIGWEAERSHIE